MERAIIITSIHGVTKAVEKFLSFDDWEVILVGDRKTPKINQDKHQNLTYLSIKDQKSLPGHLHKLPYNHYCRKNLGYLYAIIEGASVIADTDDDNYPKADWKEWPSNKTKARTISDTTFTNVYQYFTDEFVWPRGFPLNELTSEQATPDTDEIDFDEVGVIQGLADVEPDVDAIFRLVFDQEIEFHNDDPIVLEPGTYCPFNSQNTLWPSEQIYPYLYLPSTVSFRFTDILRGYIAQRGLWAADKKLAFNKASVIQDRNVHDLMADFKSEIPCYTQTKKAVTLLDGLELAGDPLADIRTIYTTLEKENIVEPRELEYLDHWLSAI
jgi:hypothetical protein